MTSCKHIIFTTNSYWSDAVLNRIIIDIEFAVSTRPTTYCRK
jgi:hypothetical protein